MGIFKDCGCGCNGEIAKQKFIISLFAACIFFIVMNQNTFNFTSRTIGSWITTSGGCPTMTGFGLHTIVFMLVAFGTMMIKDQSNIHEKMRVSALSSAIFYIIANPNTFKFIASILGKWVADSSGCPSVKGLLLHTGVFVLVLYLTMNSRKVKCNKQ
tara:strand:+ start:2205 stop:2675 length:471 start_codon:yes stop_codon:yes gene_type:complete